MSDELPKSRFYMWRAVFSVAHMDGEVTPEEVAFAQNYLNNAPFSEEQKEILKDDLVSPQNPDEMLAKVSEPGDQADFFQFATMLAWSDDDYSHSEKALLDRLKNLQKERVDDNDMMRRIRESRKAAILRRALEDEEFKSQAKDLSPFIGVLGHLNPQGLMDTKSLEPDDEMFALWRAVFSLVHADDEIADEEREYIAAMMRIFHFNEAQQEIVYADLDSPIDVVELFSRLKTKAHIRQFFIMARSVIWCDGVYHEDEAEAIKRIMDYLGEHAGEFEEELSQIENKPAEAQGGGASGQEAMMTSVVRQMMNFYKKRGSMT